MINARKRRRIGESAFHGQAVYLSSFIGENAAGRFFAVFPDRKIHTDTPLYFGEKGGIVMFGCRGG